MGSKFFDESIILIGPSGAGKSTIAEELSKITGIDRVCLDKVANDERRKGVRSRFESSEAYNYDLLSRLVKAGKLGGKPYIVDFGAGHSVYEQSQIFEQVRQLLSHFKNIVLLLPCIDKKEALEIMAKRSTGDINDNERFFTSNCNRELATMTIFANGRNPQQIAEDLLRMIEERNSENKDKQKQVQ